MPANAYSFSDLAYVGEKLHGILEAKTVSIARAALPSGQFVNEAISGFTFRSLSSDQRSH